MSKSGRRRRIKQQPGISAGRIGSALTRRRLLVLSNRTPPRTSRRRRRIHHLIPVLGIAAGHLLLAERLTGPQWLGAVLIVVAVGGIVRQESLKFAFL